MKLSKKLFDAYIGLIIFIKLCYIVTIILKNMKLNKKLKKKVEYYHEKLHVLFYLSMGILLIVLFNPYIDEARVSGHEKLFIFVLGILMVIDILKRYFNNYDKLERGIHVADVLVEII